MPRLKSTPARNSDDVQKKLSWSSHEQQTNEACTSDVDPGWDGSPPVKRSKRRKSQRYSCLNDELSRLLSQCDFYLTIQNKSAVKLDSWVCHLGVFEVTLSPLPEDVSLIFDRAEYWLYVSEDTNKCFLYFEDGDGPGNCLDKTAFYFIEQLPPYDVLTNAHVKHNFILRHRDYSLDDRRLKIDVLLRVSGVSHLAYASENAKSKMHAGMQAIMNHFYGIHFPDYTGKDYNKHHNINDLFEAVKRYHRQNLSSGNVKRLVQHPSLIPTLRLYQADAVRWMLKQELVPEGNENADELHELFVHVKSLDDVNLYYNVHGDFIVLERPTKVIRRPGGILADEMGLGKTVEVLTCVLCHPRCTSNEVQDSKACVQQLGNDESKSFFADLEKLPKMTGDQELMPTKCSTSYDNDFLMTNGDGKLLNESQLSTDVSSMSSFHGELEESRNGFDLNNESVIDSADTDKNSEPIKCELVKREGKSFSAGSESVDFADNSDDGFNSSEASQLSNKFIKKTSRLLECITIPERSCFECICGSSGTRKSKIQCTKCGLLQHADCVKYNSNLGPYFCPHCWISQPPIMSSATLIVSPASIQNQWLDEIRRHLRQKALSIFVYTGIHKQGFIQPQTLAQQDLVITSYETLRKEISYVDLPHSNSETSRRFRNPKRFMAVPSPLVAIEWWRICLDEAQMVECTTTKTAEMALRLSAVNRWCITGTPIQKSIEDLYGLLLFLGADPFWVKRWWSECLYNPYCYGNIEPLLDVINGYLWRTSKLDVLDQIDLPKQSVETHWLRFSPVEEHFYRQQHAECSRDSFVQFNKVTDLHVNLSSVDRKSLSQLLAPLRRLRQACCHPQAVRGLFMSIHKNTLTMEELLQSLIKKTKNEAEEAHRQHTAALNGLAALHIINENWADAADTYRDVLRLAAEHSLQIKTDKLQRLHALHNLAELLDAGHECIAPTLRDDKLKDEAAELRIVYLAKCAAKVAASQEVLRVAQEAVQQTIWHFSCSEPWWSSSLSSATKIGKAEDLVERIKNDLSAVNSSNQFSLVNRFRDVLGMKYTIVTQLDDLNATHSSLVKAVQALSPNPSAMEINAAVECHLRPLEKKPSKCNYCQIHDLFNKYEAKLFCFRAGKNDSLHIEASTSEDALMGPSRRGTWADSEVEHMLKIILTFAKTHSHQSVVDDGISHVKLFEALKKEFKGLRGVWMQIRDHVSALDELNMATIRLRLRFPDEPRSDPPQHNILEPSEIDHHRLKLLSDRIVARNDTHKKLGQLLYLQNLAKSDYSKRGGSNPEPCPICQHPLGEQWTVLQCGHSFCVECIRILVVHQSHRHHFLVKCPVCRQKTHSSEVSYVNTKSEEAEDVQQIEVKGSYSTKIEGIVRTLLQIKQKEPQAKALVFSTWQNVLDVLAKALVDNEISFRALYRNAKYQLNLSSFKRDPDIMCLLLLVNSGANGLNLVEATHVLLAEPILNPAHELQAIGRVHRIGQTRLTQVHHFLVRGTIEEKINSLLRFHSTTMSTRNSEENTLTLAELKNLFTDDDKVEDL